MEKERKKWHAGSLCIMPSAGRDFSEKKLCRAAQRQIAHTLANEANQCKKRATFLQIETCKHNSADSPCHGFFLFFFFFSKTLCSPTYLSAVEHLGAGDVDKADHVTAVFDVVGHAEPPGGVPLQVVVVEEPANLRQRRRRRRTAQRHRRALFVNEALLEGFREDGRTVAQLQLARRLAGLLL